MGKLILLRHGESEWNKLNLFTGWVDIPLSEKGIEESLKAGQRIAHFPIDLIFTSTLFRALMTAILSMTKHSSGKVPLILHSHEDRLKEGSRIYSPVAEKNSIPLVTAWELNERMYGQLQGLNKQETIDKYGQEQVHIWRRSFEVAPPGGESLEMTAARAIPYFQKKIVPFLEEGKNIFIAAHGNSLRAIIMFLENLSKEEVLHLELVTGEPLVYNYVDSRWKKMGINE